MQKFLLLALAAIMIYLLTYFKIEFVLNVMERYKSACRTNSLHIANVLGFYNYYNNNNAKRIKNQINCILRVP